MTIQSARHECQACCPLQAEKPGIQPVVGNTHDTHVEQVVSSFQKILRGSQLTWYSSLVVAGTLDCMVVVPSDVALDGLYRNLQLGQRLESYN